MTKNKEHANRVIVSSGIPEFALKELEKLTNQQKNEKGVLTLEGIDKIYENGFQAIFGTSLKLKKGEFLALLGPSGCGKSTTLRMIAGLEEVTRGEILINDINVTQAEPSDRNLTMVFQNYALFPHLSVKGNISFGLKSNKKKLGNAGKIYAQMRMINNQISSLKTLIKNINSIDSFEKRIITLKDKKEKQLSRQHVLEQKLIANSENTRIIKSLDNTKINIITLENLLEKGREELLYLQKEINNIEKHKNEVVELTEKVNKMEKERQELAKNDDYAKIIDEKVEEAAKTLGLEYYLDRKPSALSGGQRQRVALGRSIVGTPTLFLMDEPLSNLDAKLRASMRRQIRELHEKINSATVYVTHDQVEAMTMADKIGVMQDGFIMQIGTPKDVYTNPSCAFVASFVGLPSMNMIDGKVLKGHFVSNDKKFKIPLLPKDKLINATEGQEVIFGVRPTDFSLDPEVGRAYNNKVQVKVIARELLGNEIQYTCKMKNSEIEISFLVSSYDNYPIGKEIDIFIRGSRIHLFDKKTSIALTSEFNYETLISLKNWSVSGEKIEVRRKILEEAKLKSHKKTLLQKAKGKLKQITNNK